MPTFNPDRRRFMQATLIAAGLIVNTDNHPRVKIEPRDNQKYYALYQNLANLQRPPLQPDDSPFNRSLHLNLALSTQPFITSLSSESDPTDTFRTCHVKTPSIENIPTREIEITAFADPHVPLSNRIQIISTLHPSQTLISIIDNNPASEPLSQVMSPDYTFRGATLGEVQSLTFDLGRASFSSQLPNTTPISIPQQIG